MTDQVNVKLEPVPLFTEVYSNSQMDKNFLPRINTSPTSSPSGSKRPMTSSPSNRSRTSDLFKGPGAGGYKKFTLALKEPAPSTCTPHAVVMITNTHSGISRYSALNINRPLCERKLDARDYKVVGIFPDEVSAIQKKRQLLQEMKIKKPSKFLNGDWSVGVDFLVRPYI
mmetsp:Transcript_22652/g.33115  ORF Transcript_22652/g.33115 Transcript_22652/m.33115 type:complete len:170 (-) Transcript_22652:211-720(-)